MLIYVERIGKGKEKKYSRDKWIRLTWHCSSAALIDLITRDWLIHSWPYTKKDSDIKNQNDQSKLDFRCVTRETPHQEACFRWWRFSGNAPGRPARFGHTGFGPWMGNFASGYPSSFYGGILTLVAFIADHSFHRSARCHRALLRFPRDLHIHSSSKEQINHAMIKASYRAMGEVLTTGSSGFAFALIAQTLLRKDRKPLNQML